MASITRSIAAACAIMFASTAAYAADCTTDKTDPFELDEAEVVSLYDCIQGKMIL